MPEPTNFTYLRNLLAELYPDEASMRRLMAEASLNTTRITLSSNAINNWHAIWTEAEKTEKLGVLLGLALAEYGENSQLRQAVAEYLRIVRPSSASKPTRNVEPVPLFSVTAQASPARLSQQRQWWGIGLTLLFLLMAGFSTYALGWWPSMRPAPAATNAPTAATNVAVVPTATFTSIATATVIATAQALGTDQSTPAVAFTPTTTATEPPTPTFTPTATATPMTKPLPTATATPVAGQKKVVTVKNVDFTFVYLPSGVFQMGSPAGTGSDDEHPPHAQTVAGLWVGQTEVTNEQYALFIAADGYVQKKWWNEAGWQWREQAHILKPACLDDANLNQPDYPVVCLSWYEAVAYTRWLAHETNLPMRLASEAEWEYAARGVDGRTYPWGDGWDGSRLNYCDKNCEYSHKDDTIDDGFAKTAPVGSYPKGATPEGVLDMAGNVWEWTSSVYKPYPYQADDGREDEKSADSRVVRGGSWYNGSSDVRSAFRYRINPDYRGSNFGLRLVVSAPNKVVDF